MSSTGSFTKYRAEDKKKARFEGRGCAESFVHNNLDTVVQFAHEQAMLCFTAVPWYTASHTGFVGKKKRPGGNPRNPLMAEYTLSNPTQTLLLVKNSRNPTHRIIACITVFAQTFVHTSLF